MRTDGRDPAAALEVPLRRPCVARVLVLPRDPHPRPRAPLRCAERRTRGIWCRRRSLEADRQLLQVKQLRDARR